LAFHNARASAFLIGLLASACLVAACSPHDASVERGVATHDPLVTVFRADRETAWRSFRLGGGLNVVVVSDDLPRTFAWRFQSGGISSSPTVMGTTILVSANDHHLYAIDGVTGSLRWRYRAENEVMSQPAYANGLVYVGTGNNGDMVYDPPHFVVIGEGMNKLEAIDAATGIEAWWSGLDGTGMPSQAIIGGTIVAADGAGTVLAVDAHTGAYRWHRRLPSAFAMSSVVDGEDGRIYLSGRLENAVYALRARDGAPAWKHRFSDLDGAIGADPLALTPVALVGMYLEPVAPGPRGLIVTEGARAREHVYALDRRTGRMLWDTRLASVVGRVPRYNEAAIPAIYGGRIYIGSAVAPIVTALDANGRVLWQTRVDGPVKGGICARDGILYLGDLGGHLWALDARTGRVVGSTATDMQFNTGSPIVVNDSLVIGGRSDVVALPLSAIRDSRQVAGITRLTLWERIGRSLGRIVPQRDPHLEKSYARH